MSFDLKKPGMASIHQTDKPDQPNYIAKDFSVDIKQKNGQPAKEKEQWEMK